MNWTLLIALLLESGIADQMHGTGTENICSFEYSEIRSSFTRVYVVKIIEYQFFRVNASPKTCLSSMVH